MLFFSPFAGFKVVFSITLKGFFFLNADIQCASGEPVTEKVDESCLNLLKYSIALMKYARKRGVRLRLTLCVPQ